MDFPFAMFMRLKHDEGRNIPADSPFYPQLPAIYLLLFGSYARGDAHPQSDVDLLVVFSECADKRKTAVDIRRALADLPGGKDIIVATPQELERQRDWVGAVLRSAQREGKILYERARSIHRNCALVALCGRRSDNG